MAKVSMITFATFALLVRLALCLVVPNAQGAVEEILRDGSMGVETAIKTGNFPLVASSFGTRTALTLCDEFLAKRQNPSSNAPSVTPSVAPTTPPPASTTPPPPVSTTPPPPVSTTPPPASTPGVPPTTTTSSSTSTTSAAASSSSAASSSGSSASTGAIAGGTVGGIAGALLIVAVLVWWKWSSIKGFVGSTKAGSAAETVPAEEAWAEKDFSVGRYDSYADVSSSSGVLSSGATSTSRKF